MKHALLIGSAIVGALPSPAAAANWFSYTPPQPPPPPDPGPLLLRLFGMTLFVLLTCAVLLWFLRLARRPRVFGKRNDDLRLLESAHLTGRCSMHLVQAGGARILIAVDPAGMKSCHLVDDNFASVLGGLGVDGAREQGPSVAEMMSVLAASRQAA